MKVKHDAKIGDKVEYKGSDWEIVTIETRLVLKSIDTSATAKVSPDDVEWIGY